MGIGKKSVCRTDWRNLAQTIPKVYIAQLRSFSPAGLAKRVRSRPLLVLRDPTGRSCKRIVSFRKRYAHLGSDDVTDRIHASLNKELNADATSFAVEGVRCLSREEFDASIAAAKNKGLLRAHQDSRTI
jgi:hypothetical protein